MEWELEQGVWQSLGQVRTSALRIHVIKPTASQDRETDRRIYLNVAAYKDLGEPEYVQIYLRKGDRYAVKLAKCDKHGTNARRVRRTKKMGNNFRIGGATNLIKRYNMAQGYYLHKGNGVFMWKSADPEACNE